MNQDEVESQLSAMFDGELPPAECELLSRRIDRDESLRARWSRYALIGAAMRCEPVATARSDFAARVSRAVDRAAEGRSAGERRSVGRARAGGAASDTARLAGRRGGLLWQTALAAALVVCVAGFSILMLRYVALAPTTASPGVATLAAAATTDTPAAVAAAASEQLLARARQAAVVLGLAPEMTHPPAAPTAPLSDREPWSYVTPTNDSGGGSTPLRTELVDYIVAHSEYSTPLMRPDLLSALISGGQSGPDGVWPISSGVAGAADAPGSAQAGPTEATDPAAVTPANAAAGDLDANPAPATSP